MALCRICSIRENLEFSHVTSSPTHAQSNGKAEGAVKTVKRLFTKCQESGLSEYLALLDWRNTPSQGIGTSPAQRLMGRRCKTLLPIAGTLLMPRHNTEKKHEHWYEQRNGNDFTTTQTQSHYHSSLLGKLQGCDYPERSTGQRVHVHRNWVTATIK